MLLKGWSPDNAEPHFVNSMLTVHDNVSAEMESGHLETFVAI